MPWSDNNNPGPWGSPPKDEPPRRPGRPGRRPGRGGRTPPTPPDFNALLDRAGRKARDFLSGPGGRGVNPRSIGLVAAGVAGLYLLSGVYLVQANETGVVTTFGAYSRSTGPGPHIHLPWPIEAVQVVSTTNLNSVDIGGGASDGAESLMLTGDENIIDLDFSAQYRIADPAKYLFNVADPEGAVRAVAESAMREIVGKSALQALLTTERGKAQDEALTLMQRTLDGYQSGILVTAVQIRNAGPPARVVDAFRDVARASQDSESAVNVARGEAARIQQEALGYQAQVTREAAGEASRFNQIYEQYRLSPRATRERLYIETMERVIGSGAKIIVDSNSASAPVILPQSVLAPRAAAPATTVTPAPPAGGR